MLKWFMQFLHPSKKTREVPKPLIEQYKPQKPQQRSQPQKTKVEQLLRQVKSIGHSEYPFLHKDYSPVSRVPCRDFTDFIIERLEAHDTPSISALMKEIIRANPGVGIGTNTEWIERSVHDIIQATLTRYIQFDSNRAYTEMKAMMIIASKSGMKREFWIVDNKVPFLFAQALCCYSIEILPTIETLIQNANVFIKKMKKETRDSSSYWTEYPLFPAEITVPLLQDTPCRQKICSLSIGTRLHLLNAVSQQKGSLPKLTDYRTRDFGLHLPQTTQDILKSGFMVKTKDREALSKHFTKNALLSLCQEHAIEYKKSWKKSKLLQAIQKNNPEFIDNISEELQIVTINPEYEKELLMFHQYAQNTEKLYALLCFI